MPNNILEQILSKATKPARYTGGELNSILKDLTTVTHKIALAYPDTYEVGMSNLGIQILYRVLNSIENVAAERVFAPWPDLEAELTQNGFSLFSQESKLPPFRF